MVEESMPIISYRSSSVELSGNELKSIFTALLIAGVVRIALPFVLRFRGERAVCFQQKR